MKAYSTELVYKGKEYSATVFETDLRGKITACDITHGACEDLGFEGEEGEIRDRLYTHLEDNWDHIFSEENKKFQLVPEKT